MKKGDEPAFPSDLYDFQPASGQQVIREQQFGLTKREWFAGMAMQGICANSASSIVKETYIGNFELVSQWAFQYADAMLYFEEKEAGEKE